MRLDRQLRETGDLWGLLFAPRAAGFLAPVFWIANGTLATVMSWTSAYNQVLCAFFLLAAFWSLLLYVETEKRRYMVLQWMLFLLGFGALETNVVYPALAAAFVFLTARKHLRSILWLFPLSFLYAFAHFYYAPAPVSGPYRMHWSARMVSSLWTYWEWSLGFVLVQLRKRHSVPAFLLLWFLLLIAPVLLAALYLASSVPVARAVTHWRYQSSQASRNLVQGLIRVHELHPGKLILLTGVSSDLFWLTIFDKAQWLAGVRDLYLAPGSEESIEANPELGTVSEYLLPPAVVVRALEDYRVLVYDASGDRLRNVTTYLPGYGARAGGSRISPGTWM